VPPSRKSTKKLTQKDLETYLGKLYRFLKGYTWGDQVKKKKTRTKKKKGKGGGQGSGSNPPKWPP